MCEVEYAWRHAAPLEEAESEINAVSQIRAIEQREVAIAAWSVMVRHVRLCRALHNLCTSVHEPRSCAANVAEIVEDLVYTTALRERARC
jgi:hypothetical protein